MDENNAVLKTIKFLEKELKEDVTGHDIWHSLRVMKLSLKIAEEEFNNEVDLMVVKMASLLHDLADWKFGNNMEKIKEWLKNLNLSESRINHICYIIDNISFKGLGVKSEIRSREGKIVQDADRLDSLGAIGIARCFATGAKLGNKIYDPEIEPKMHRTFEDYKKERTTSINHFYEKLLFLKDLMHTKTAKRIAEERHKFMSEFLEKFFKEWEGQL